MFNLEIITVPADAVCQQYVKYAMILVSSK